MLHKNTCKKSMMVHAFSSTTLESEACRSLGVLHQSAIQNESQARQAYPVRRCLKRQTIHFGGRSVDIVFTIQTC